MIAERMRLPDGTDSGRMTAMHLRFLTSELAVRAVLWRWRGWMQAAAACPDLTGRAEIVLAEVLNNITEHVAGDGPTSWIDLRCDLIEAGLSVVVADQGRPLPRHLLHQPSIPAPVPISAALADLPEGGFGWTMIRALTQDLTCDSDSRGNRLRFIVPRLFQDG